MRNQGNDFERSFKRDIEESIQRIKAGEMSESLKLLLIARKKRKSVVDFRNYIIGVLYEEELENDLVDLFSLLIEVYGEGVMANPDLIDVEAEVDWKDFYQFIQKAIQGQVKINLPQHGYLSPIMQVVIVPEMMDKLTQFKSANDEEASNVEALQGLQRLFDQLVAKEKPLTILEKAQVNHLLELSDQVAIDKLLKLLNRDRDFVFQSDILLYIYHHAHEDQEIILSNIYDEPTKYALNNLFEIETNNHFLALVSYVEEVYIHEPYRVAYLMENIYDIYTVMYPFVDELNQIDPEDMVEAINQLMESGDPLAIENQIIQDIYQYWFYEYMQHFASFE
ncbi:hypothetical protein AAK938_03265 [Aerococcaceae bacterium 50-4]